MRLTSVDRQIVAVAIPAFFALVTEPLMLAADTAIVGHLGTTPLAGLAAASVILGTVAGLCVFLAYGSTAAVARQHGSGDDRAAFSTAIGGVWLAVILGVVLGGFLLIAGGPLCQAVSSSGAVAEQAQTYLSISAFAVPAMLLMLAVTGALRGLLDLRTPLIVAIAANLANVVLSLTFVYGLDGGIAGAATGTVLAQWGGAVLLVGVLLHKARAAEAGVAPELGTIVRAALDGVPLFIRTLTLRASLILATVVAAQLGNVPLAAHQIVTTLVTFFAFGLDAIAIAGQTLTGRSLGAGDPIEARSLTRRMVLWGWWTGGMAGLVLAATALWIGRLFTADAQVLSAVIPALLVVAAIQPLSGVVFVLDGVLIGAGDGVYLAVAGLVVLVIYTPLALTVAWTDGHFAWLWAAYGGFIAARLATLWLRERSDAWIRLGPQSR